MRVVGGGGEKRGGSPAYMNVSEVKRIKRVEDGC